MATFTVLTSFGVDSDWLFPGVRGGTFTIIEATANDFAIQYDMDGNPGEGLIVRFHSDTGTFTYDGSNLPTAGTVDTMLLYDDTDTTQLATLASASYLLTQFNDPTLVHNFIFILSLLTGDAGADLLHGYLLGGGATGIWVGGDGSDTFVLDSSYPSYSTATLHGSAADGSGGAGETNTVVIRSGYQWNINAGATDIDALVFDTTFTGGPTGVLFYQAPEAGGISDTLAVTGDGYQNNLGFALFGTSIDLSGLTFTNWSAGSDTISVNGSGTATSVVGSMVGDYIYSLANSGATVAAGLGNDTIYGGSGNDNIDGGDDADLIQGNGGTDTLMGGAGNDTVNGSTGNDSIDGGDGDDVISGNSGADTLLGGLGLDTIIGGSGNDYIDGGDDNDTIVGNGGVDTLLGGLGNDSITGGTGADSIDGGNGDDIITCGGGLDTLIGGAGSDLFVLTSTVDLPAAIHGSAADGTGGAGEINLIRTYAQFNAFNDLRSLTTTNIDGFRFTNFAFFNFDGITGARTGGGYGAALIDASQLGAGLSSDLVLDGFSGNRTALAIELSAPGTVDASGFTTVNAAASSYLHITGSSGADAITGWSLTDYVVSNGGADTIATGAGNDTVFLNHLSSGGSVDGGADSDTLVMDWRSAASGLAFTLLDPAVTSTGPGGMTVTGFETLLAHGSALGDAIGGYDGNDTIYSGAGNDTVSGGGGNDYVFSSDGADSVSGGAGNDTIEGGIGNDTIDAGTGVNFVFAGDDNDTVAILFGQGGGGYSGDAGTDFAVIDGSALSLNITFDVFAQQSFSVQLADGTHIAAFEQIQFTGGSGNDNLAGGDLADILIGNAGLDTLSGRDGNDQLLGGAGIDLLDGGNGNDTLDGGSGSDRLDGGAGNDSLLGGSGNDVIDGGEGDDTISGGAGADMIDGGDGFDVVNMAGATVGVTVDRGNAFGSTGEAYGDVYIGIERFELTAFNDTFRGVDDAENIIGGEGNDSIYGGNGNDSMAGGNGSDRLYGNSGDDRLYGGSGGDRLVGGDGNDTLAGNGGNDTFHFETALDEALNVDTISDFSNVAGNNDSFRLSSTIFSAFSAGHTLTNAEFVFGAGVTAATTADQHIIYDTTTGWLYYDQDGSGGTYAAIHFATVNQSGGGHPALTASDFVVY